MDIIDPTLTTTTRLLSDQEDAFILAYIETGNNARLAYQMVFGEEAQSPVARAYALLARPEIIGRINELSSTISAQEILSIQAHVQQLAEIRDAAKMSGSLKVALAAEVKRGEVAGLYVGKTGASVALINPPSVPQPDRLTRIADRLVNLNRRTDTVDVAARVVED